MVKILCVICGIVVLYWNLSRYTTLTLLNKDAQLYTNNVHNESILQLEDNDVNETMRLTNDNALSLEHVHKGLSHNGSLVLRDSHKIVSHVNTRKKILFWNEFYNSLTYGKKTDILARRGCPVHQCSFTSDKSQLKTVDAVFIHGLQPDLPTERTENQIYVFHLFESPIRTTSRLSQLPKWQDVFNLTFTYMYDAETDISASHGRAMRRSKPNPRAVPSLQVIKKKTKLVLWIVSNCHPHSGRMEYAKQLAQYVPVDVVGRCGNLSCPLPKSPKTCIEKLAKDYMFYLAFENSYCKDYYTEKVTNPLAFGMVPITMGRTKYSKFLPPYSYIDANDYSPRQLAQKLLHLKNVTNDYMKYFQWREQYAMLWSIGVGFCRLCKILHTTNYPYKSNFSLARYWDADKLCLTKSEHLAQLRIE